MRPCLAWPLCHSMNLPWFRRSRRRGRCRVPPCAWSTASCSRVELDEQDEITAWSYRFRTSVKAFWSYQCFLQEALAQDIVPRETRSPGTWEWSSLKVGGRPCNGHICRACWISWSRASIARWKIFLLSEVHDEKVGRHFKNQTDNAKSRAPEPVDQTKSAAYC